MFSKNWLRFLKDLCSGYDRNQLNKEIFLFHITIMKAIHDFHRNMHLQEWTSVQVTALYVYGYIVYVYAVLIREIRSC